MGTYYIGLSMAGTVSAGTYTAGCLVEMNNWLVKWRNAVQQNKPVELAALTDTANYKKGDKITLLPEEIPKHEVKIKTLTGSSGGGVSGALYMIGLATGQVEKYLNEKWQSFSIEKMLDLSDLPNENVNVFSILNVLPIEDIVKELKVIKWDSEERLKNIDYIADVLELYQTLSSYEPIPYKMVHYKNQQKNFGIFKTHFDYIRFGLMKSSATENKDSTLPYRHQLKIKANSQLKDNEVWQKLLESTPATGAFPFGFKPRLVKRTRKEYEGKLFYLDTSIERKNRDFSKVSPHWTKEQSPGEEIYMEYFDGGTFNREPHDLARASLIRFLQNENLLKEDELPNDGVDTFASVILVDPFPAEEEPVAPGKQVSTSPVLLQQPGLLINALMNQGRFHPEWIDKATDEQYYSRYLISPKREPVKNSNNEYTLAGEPFAAFGGFLHEKYRQHDYMLGRYNTFKFLWDSYTVPTNNKTINYCQNISAATEEKYMALGWMQSVKGFKKQDDGTEVPAEWKECQIIPRFEDQLGINSTMPNWPKMDRKTWEGIREKAQGRAKPLFKTILQLGNVIEWGAWKFFVSKQMDKVLDRMEEELIKAQLLEK